MKPFPQREGLNLSPKPNNDNDSDNHNDIDSDSDNDSDQSSSIFNSENERPISVSPEFIPSPPMG